MESVYVPLVAVFVEAFTRFVCSVSMRAPLIAVPSLARVMVPVIVPVPTVKFAALLGTAATVTRTGPVVAELGTGTTMLVLPQLAGVALVPLNVTVLDP